MNEQMHSRLQQLVVIDKKKQKDKLLDLLMAHGAQGLNVMYGKGSAGGSVWAQAFGLGEEEHKVMITCLIATENAAEVLRLLCKEHEYSKPNTGICFCIPVEGLLF